MTAQTLTALYDTRSTAETARDDLVALGIPSDDITIHGAEGGSTATADTTEDKGFWGSIMDALFPEEDRHTYTEGIRRGGYLLSVRVSEDMQGRAVEVLERSDPVDIDERAESWRQSGWTGYEAGSTTTGAAAADTGQAGSVVGAAGGATSTAGTEGYAAREQSSTSGAESLRTGATEGEGSIPVIEEEVRVGKREAGGGRVRVRSYVTERPVEEQVNLRQEQVNVERRPVDRPVEPGEAVFQEKEIEAVERTEEAVASKQARVVEEVALSKDVDTRTETVRDTVRKTEVEVEDDRTGRGSTGTEEITTSRDRSDR
jgi:stress response protein YsnF